MFSNRILAWLSALTLAAALWGGGTPNVGAQAENAPLPVHIKAEHVLIDAPIEPTQVVNGVMSELTGLWYVGAVSGGSRLDEPGFSVFQGQTQFTGTPFGAFFYLQDSVPGQIISVTGSDGADYDFAVVSNEVLSPDQAIGSLDQAPGDANTWIDLLSWARYDANLGTSPGLVLVKAARTSDAPRIVEKDIGAQADPISGCTELSYLPPQAWYLGAAQMEVSSAELADQVLTEELKVPLDSVVPGCDVEVKSAIQLGDGNVLALVGPTGQVFASELDNAIDWNIPAVTDYDRTGVFQFVLFINQGGSWAVTLGPTS